jgi:small conductance mechanosensitive channel
MSGLIGATGAAAERFSSDWWTAFAIEVGIAVAVALVVSLLMRRYVRRYRRRANEAGDGTEGRRRRRLATVVGLGGATAIVLAWVVVVTTVLSAFQINLGPLIASAGIAGVALGFGAQTLVRDTISGLFIVIESQYDIGDTVDLETEGGLVSGTVEVLTLRVTSVRQFDGTLSTVPNGLVQISRNKTRGWGRAIVDIRVALSEDPEHVREVLTPILAALAEEVPLAGSLRKAPEVLGVTQLTDVAQVIRIAAETEPSKRWVVERELRARMTAAMNEAGIKGPPVVAQGSQPGGVL